MRLSKKKISVFLVAIALSSIAVVVYASESTANNAEKSSFGQLYSTSGNEPNFSIGSGGIGGTGELFTRTMLTVLLVVVLGIAAIYLSKKLLPRFSCLPGKRIQVSETVHLGPRKAIHLIKIDEQTLLIGSTNENITKLADVTDPLSDVNLPVNPTDNN